MMQANVFIGQVEFPQTCAIHVFQLETLYLLKVKEAREIAVQENQ